MELPDHRLTPEEFLELEAKSEERLEYINGFAVAQNLPSDNHAAISLNLTGWLNPIVKAKGCVLRPGTAKVITRNGDRMIPDLVVTCDERDLTNLRANFGKDEPTFCYPWLIIEILSPSTAEYDRTDKFDAYRIIEELTHYVLINSERRDMRVFERLPDGSFKSRAPVQRLILPTLGEHSMSIDEVYMDTHIRRLEEVRSQRI
ncbi:MAG TPA: Uma2 family endonuclease [Candidatus Baltobacteraceae bacterium]|nr:Uma2 family endonuclease [Candidatus Baltobacteraceae bacterium]